MAQAVALTDAVDSIAGPLLICLISAWAVWSLAAQLRSNIKAETAIDRTLSEIDKNDAPGMFSIQIIGLVLLIGLSALIGIGAIVALIQRIL